MGLRLLSSHQAYCQRYKFRNKLYLQPLEAAVTNFLGTIVGFFGQFSGWQQASSDLILCRFACNIYLVSFFTRSMVNVWNSTSLRRTLFHLLKRLKIELAVNMQRTFMFEESTSDLEHQLFSQKASI